MGLRDVLGFALAHPLNRGRGLGALGRLLRWQLGSRLLPYPVALPFVDGLSLLVERAMTGATGNFYCGLHEADDMAFVLHFLRPGDCFYDVGANVGSYSLLAAAAGASRIVAFEPSPGTAARFRRNMVFNELQERVTLHQTALGAEQGKVRFSRNGGAENHVLADGEEVEAEWVPMAKLDDFFVPAGPFFLKLDVEGFERQVLAGAGSALSSPDLLGMLVEDDGIGLRYGREDTIGPMLVERGLAAFHYDSRTRRLEPALHPGRSGNLLLLRDLAAAQARVADSPRFRLVNGWI